MTTIQPVRTTSAKAVSGFIFAFLFAPLGLVLSLWALPETRRGERGGYGLAVAGLVVSGIVVAFYVLLVALLTAQGNR